MVLNVIDNPFHYELQKLCGAFFPDKPIRVYEGIIEDTSEFEGEEIITAQLISSGSGKAEMITIRITYKEFESVETVPRFFNDVDCLSLSLAESQESIELHTAQLLYKTLSEALNKKLSWGILTGIRPSKLLIRLMEDKGEKEGIEYFNNCFYVDPKKTELAASVARAEKEIISSSSPDAFSLYISIPFCPTRCSYCSFVSSSVGKDSAKQIIPVYLENLLKEIEFTSRLVKQAGIRIFSAYIGGGTPSTLSAEEIDLLLGTINKSFDMSSCKEFTFEAGRPDTITDEKLKAILGNGIDRISINPQTMSDKLLKDIGRCHTAKDIITAFEAARKIGFKNINMDLIAGLPNDNLEGFRATIDEILKLDPESITVHTLAYKRSSDLDYREGLFNDGVRAEAMVELSNDSLIHNGYIPYYMYRQAKSVGNLENVGFSKPGYESFYNVFMMEECHSIMACGAGAVTKLKDPHGNEIKRIFNFKYPYEYNSRFDELLERKKAVLDFYG